MSRGATSPKIATSRRARGSGSNYMLASYQTGGDTGTASSASAVSPNTTTTAPTTSSSTTPVNVYLYAGDQIIENVTTGYFYYQDSLGNTSHVTDAVGNLLERYTYSAFGIPTFYNSLTPNGGSASAPALGIKHLFQGQLWTQETGLNDYRNRVELPVMGVFLQPDPIGFKGDAANIYRFCNNNAVNRTDPMGLIDSNNFDPNTPDYAWAQRADLHRFSDLFSYGAHGGDHDYNYGQALNPAYRSTGQTIPLNTVIASIKGNPIFQHRSGTLLIVCNSGADRSTFARSVAMGTGKDVLAPSKYLWLLDQKDHPFVVAGGYRDSRTGELKMNKNDPGHLTRFHPDGSSKAGADYKISAKDANGAIPVGGSGVDGRSSGPTAAEVDAAHQATGVPSQAAEAVNHVRAYNL